MIPITEYLAVFERKCEFLNYFVTLLVFDDSTEDLSLWDI